MSGIAPVQSGGNTVPILTIILLLGLAFYSYKKWGGKRETNVRRVNNDNSDQYQMYSRLI